VGDFIFILIVMALLAVGVIYIANKRKQDKARSDGPNQGTNDGSTPGGL
jgi:cbb3-type cytochrome oxidase subunit 3